MLPFGCSLRKLQWSHSGQLRQLGGQALVKEDQPLQVYKSIPLGQVQGRKSRLLPNGESSSLRETGKKTNEKSLSYRLGTIEYNGRGHSLTCTRMLRAPPIYHVTSLG